MANLILRETAGNPQRVALLFEAGASILASDGSVPFHVHTCPSDGKREAHAWRCNSPYCSIFEDLCPDHGGIEPVRVGREPWRGR